MTKPIRYRRRRSLGSMIKGLLIVIVILAPIAVMGSKFWIETRVENDLAQLRQMVFSMGELSYRAINAGFDGTLTVNGLSFYPDEQAQVAPFLTESARVRFADYISMMKAFQAGPPRQMTVEFRGVRGGLGRDSVSGNPFEALACGDGATFSAGELGAMGISELLANLTVSYRFDPSRERLELSMQQDTVGQALASVDLGFEAPGMAQLSASTAQLQELRLKDAQATLNAAAFMRTRNAYCGEVLGISADQAGRRNVDQWLAVLREKGWEPNAALRAQYQTFMQTGGPWSLSLRPQPSVAAGELAGLEPQQLMTTLNLAGEMGDQAPQALRMSVVSTSDDEEDEALRPTDPQSRRWVPVDLDTLRPDPAMRVRIVTTSGLRYEGEIIAVTPATVEALVQIDGGQAQLPIQRDQIQRVVRLELGAPPQDQ